VRFEADTRARRKPGLTPLIDVVFLLLVFFMLASRFDVEASLPLVVQAGAAGARTQTGALRVVIGNDDRLQLGDRIVTKQELTEAAARSDRSVVVATAPGATLQAIVDTLEALEQGGVTNAVLERRGAP